MGEINANGNNPVVKENCDNVGEGRAVWAKSLGGVQAGLLQGQGQCVHSKWEADARGADAGGWVEVGDCGSSFLGASFLSVR